MGLSSHILAANDAVVRDGEPRAVPALFSPAYRVHLTDGERSMGHAGVVAWCERPLLARKRPRDRQASPTRTPPQDHR